jgi:phenylalanyl-tRNA synthetase beta chain
VPAFESISRFPAVRRDLAVLVDEGLQVSRILELIREQAGEILRDLRVFDVYTGPGIDSGLKSIALGLILQETSRTLTDDDVDGIVAAVISRLERDLEARIRD